MRFIGCPQFFVENGSTSLKDTVSNVQSVTDIETIVDYNETKYRVHLINDGFYTVFYAFDENVLATDDFFQLSAGESKIYEGTFKSLHLICAVGKTANVRVEVR